jgi:hypothetical protein
MVISSSKLSIDYPEKFPPRLFFHIADRDIFDLDSCRLIPFDGYDVTSLDKMRRFGFGPVY